METFRIDLKHKKHITFRPTAMAIGYFDGIHLGHHTVIMNAKRIADANGYESAVMTFDPHPSVVLGVNEGQKELITPIEEKVSLIERLGIDRLYIVTFSREFASLTPQQFVDEYIIGFDVKHVVAGFDFSFGKKGEGTMETLPFHSRGSFEQAVVEKFCIHDQKVSSTLIRSLIQEGNMEQIPTYLGRPYRIRGKVIHGERRGRSIGFPTANVAPSDVYMYPAVGVYAVRMEVNGQWFEGVCNVGYKPTFHQEKPNHPSIEVFLFSFDASIYGEAVVIDWYTKIRSERKFSSVDDLKEQISNDIAQTKRYFQFHN